MASVTVDATLSSAAPEIRRGSQSWKRCARRSPKGNKDLVEVVSARGTFVGERLKGVTAFKGLPFARCHRFGLPAMIETYGHVDCTENGPMAPQPQFNSAIGALSFMWSKSMSSFVPRKLPEDMSEENCLNLQLYLPEMQEDQGPLPVFVFVHGGCFLAGSNKQDIYQNRLGCKLAAKQKFAVAFVNYRLGPFGFLKVPGGQSNLGVRDVVAALHWIHEEGPAFGLDTSSITIAGQSAGAMVCGALLHVPCARGLFQRVVMMSGSSQNLMSASDADLMGRHVADRIDVWTASTSELLGAALDMAPEHGMMPFQPSVDGEFLVENICASGIDVLLGVTENEATTFVPRGPFNNVSIDEANELLAEVLGQEQMGCTTTQAERDEIIALVEESYQVSESKDIFRRLLSGIVFEAPFLATARQLQKSNNVYVYRNMVGQGHAGELGFVFGTWNSNAITRVISGLTVWNGFAAAETGKTMESLWGGLLNSFVRTGMPSGEWPLYDEQNLAMSLSAEGMALVPATQKAIERMCDVLLNGRRPYGIKFPMPIAKL